VQPVKQPGAAGPVTTLGLPGHQSRVLEHRQMRAALWFSRTKAVSSATLTGAGASTM